jgi:protein tyrosine phosphatase (PTP) superfamily phosphohydrolase (DUF442 family)
MSPNISRIRNFHQLSDLIGTSGQPLAQEFSVIRDAGYTVVINLALPDLPNALSDEADLVAAEGMEYIHIPVFWDSPKIEDIVRFFVAMEAHNDQKIFVHCAANKRVSAFLYLYRVLRERTSEAEAAQDLHRIWQPDETWQDFINTVIRNKGMAETF